MNLGTPDAATVPAVRRFLAEFLHDTRVVELTRWLWCPLLHGIILRFRPKKALAAYQSVWTANGSPLKVITEEQTQALQAYFNQQNIPVSVCHAMTYGHPKLAQQIHACQQQGAEHFVVLPLYPQYSATTTGAIYDQYAKLILNTRNIPDVYIIKDYHQHPLYIQALVNSIKDHWQHHPKGEKLVFSFHGIPQAYVNKGDPYAQQALHCATQVADALQLPKQAWEISFQSRLGKAQWLQPYTDKLLVQLAQQGVKNLDIICPAFSADCIETLEEIQQENQHQFLAAGGQTFHYIPCLNSRPDHIHMMAQLCLPYIK